MTPLHRTAPLLPSDSPADASGAHWGCGRLIFENGQIVMENVWVAGAAGAKSLRRTLSFATSRRTPTDLSEQETAAPVHRHRSRNLLAKEAELHVEACRLRRRSAKHVDKVRHTLDFLLYAAGDIPIDEIDGSHIVAMWNVLQVFPLGARVQTRFKNKTIEQILQLSEGEPHKPPSSATMDGHHARLMAFFDELVEKAKKLRCNPMAGLDLRIGRDRAPKAERLFTTDDLAQIFEPKRYMKWASEPHRWWIPMLALYSGCRVSEIAQLHKADIVQGDGGWSFHVRATGGGQVKTPQSVRCIPIAQPLLDAGFLDFVADMAAVKHPRLFPLLAKPMQRATGLDNGCNYGTTMSAHFASYLKRIGLEQGRGMHSFRHFLITRLTHADVPDNVIKFISGHSRLINERPDERRSALPMYQHGLQLTLAHRARAALDAFDPGVGLPVYQRGQFAKALSDASKFAP